MASCYSVRLLGWSQWANIIFCYQNEKLLIFFQQIGNLVQAVHIIMNHQCNSSGMLCNSYYCEIHTATKQTIPSFFKDIEMEILEKSLIMLLVDEYSNYET